MRLKGDVFTLESLLKGETPKRIKSRLTKSVWVSYGIVDASSNSYGTIVYLKTVLIYRYGQWSSEIGELFSNYWELRNLVDTIKTINHESHLRNCELLLFIDNLVVDYVYHKGASTSKHIFGLVLRLGSFKSKVTSSYIYFTRGENERVWNWYFIKKLSYCGSFDGREYIIVFTAVKISSWKKWRTSKLN